MKTINLGILAMGVLRESIPLLYEHVQILVHVGFKLRDALGGKCMGDSLPLSSVLVSISRVEETALDGNESIVEITAKILARGRLGPIGYLRFQESISMAIDSIDSRLICHADMIWLDPDKFTPFLMRLINALVSLSLASLEQKPEVRELCSEGPWDVSYGGIRDDIWDEEEEDDSCRKCPRCEEKICDGHFRQIAAGAAAGT